MTQAADDEEDLPLSQAPTLRLAAGSPENMGEQEETQKPPKATDGYEEGAADSDQFLGGILMTPGDGAGGQPPRPKSPLVPPPRSTPRSPRSPLGPPPGSQPAAKEEEQAAMAAAVAEAAPGVVDVMPLRQEDAPRAFQGTPRKRSRSMTWSSIEAAPRWARNVFEQMQEDDLPTTGGFTSRIRIEVKFQIHDEDISSEPGDISSEPGEPGEPLARGGTVDEPASGGERGPATGERHRP